MYKISDTFPYLMVIGGYKGGEFLNSIQIIPSDESNRFRKNESTIYEPLYQPPSPQYACPH
jgi:hypothetical protein